MKIVFHLNGERVEVGADHAPLMLAEYLRRERGLTGTKVVCAEGDCGACTVLRWFPLEKRGRFLPINSCIAPLGQLHGSSLITVEALGTEQKLSPVQQAMVDCHGSQCGYCTPGFVMSLTGLVEKKIPTHEGITQKDAANALTGNLCRCTGYQSILDAACSVNVSACESVEKRFLSPAQKRELRTLLRKPLLLETADYSFFAPTTLRAALAWIKKNKQVRIAGAATDLGVVHNKYRHRLTHLLSLHQVSELYEMKATKGRLRVGARVTLANVRQATKNSELGRFLDLFASPQIKNVATLVGNVVNASPIADTPPALLVLEADVEVHGPKGKRKVPLRNFFLGYKKTALRPGEIVTHVIFDLPKKNEVVRIFKASQRKDLDISAVNAAFRWKKRNETLEQISIAYGGVAATALRLPATEKALLGRRLDKEAFHEARNALQKEISPLSDLRGSSAFRRGLAEAFLKKFFDEAGGSL